jgi:hypothetical protein
VWINVFKRDNSGVRPSDNYDESKKVAGNGRGRGGGQCYYAGRVCHIHLKVRTGGTASGPSYSTSGSQSAFGGQLFFPTAINEALRPVYSQDTNPFTNNDDDRVYTSQHGARALLSLNGTLDAGFAGSIVVNVNA